jgi:hypothetical protein
LAHSLPCRAAQERAANGNALAALLQVPLDAEKATLIRHLSLNLKEVSTAMPFVTEISAHDETHQE